MQNRSNYFDAGTLEIEVVSTRKINGKKEAIGKRFIPNSAKVGINFGDICYSIEFTVPNTPNYFIPMTDSTEIKVYLDNEFHSGGYIISSETKNNSIAYRAVGYGYEITKTFCLPLTGFTNGISVSNFVLDTIRKNLIKRNRKIVIDNKIEKQTQVYTTDFRVAFVLYDPMGYGEEIIKIETQSKYEESILSYLNNFLKPSNLFIRCLGSLDDLRPYIKNDILNNPVNKNILSNNINLSNPKQIPREEMVFVLELYKATTTKTGGSLVLDSSKLYDFSIKSEETVLDNVLNQQANFKIDYSNRYGCYFATTKEQPNISANSNNAYAEDPIISDGTAIVIQFNLNLDINRLQSLLYYEVNKRIAESYTYDCTVIGYRQGLNVYNVDNGINKSNLAFWDINQNVKVTDLSNGIDNNQFLIKGVVINWSKNGGATTNLSCTLPNAYTQEKPPSVLESEYLDEIKREEGRSKSLLTRIILTKIGSIVEKTVKQ